MNNKQTNTLYEVAPAFLLSATQLHAGDFALAVPSLWNILPGYLLPTTLDWALASPPWEVSSGHTPTPRPSSDSPPGCSHSSPARPRTVLLHPLSHTALLFSESLCRRGARIQRTWLAQGRCVSGLGPGPGPQGNLIHPSGLRASDSRLSVRRSPPLSVAVPSCHEGSWLHKQLPLLLR